MSDISGVSPHTRVTATDNVEQLRALAQQRRRARLSVATHARDAEDCALLLDALGLLPGGGRRGRRRGRRR